MAKTLVHRNVKSPIYFVQAARNSSVHAFADEVRALASERDNVQVHVFYDQPSEDDVSLTNCDEVGVINVDWLRDHMPHAQADFYFCGPKPFMQNVFAGLRELGVGDSRMHYEFFGPLQSLKTGDAAIQGDSK